VTLLDDKTDLDDADTRPSYYGGPGNPYEPVKVIDEVGLGPGFYYGSALKYMQRAGKKGDEEMKDLRKALWYLSNGVALGYEVPDAKPPGDQWTNKVAIGWGSPYSLDDAVCLVLQGKPENAVDALGEYVIRREQELQEE
jgi:hypothetical protein